VSWPPVKVRTSEGLETSIKVRASYFGPTFPRIDKKKEATGLNANARFAVMKENNGLIVLRLGRQVDVVSTGLWTQIQNNDRYWAVEVDFPAGLDEWFDVTTNKQRVAISSAAHEALRKGGIPELVERLRARYKHDRRLLQGATALAPQGAKGSAPESANDQRQAAPVASLPNGAFYLVRNAGPTFVLNDRHPFFADMYVGLGPHSRAVDAILSVLASAERNANRDRKHFYREERRKWSELLESLIGHDGHGAAEVGGAPGRTD
jgi:hypothetical protein